MTRLQTLCAAVLLGLANNARGDSEIPIRIYKNDQSLVLVETYSVALTANNATDQYSKDSNQVWQYTPSTSTLRSQSRPDDCLDAYLSDGIYKVHTYPCDTNNINQRWKINLGNGRIQHQKHTGVTGRPICLDVDAGVLQTWECNDAPWNTNQIWTIHGVQEERVLFLNNFYLRDPNYARECLAAHGGEVSLYYVHSKNTYIGSGQFGEVWLYDPMSHLLRTREGMCLDAWEPKNGGGVHGYQCDFENVNQLWNYDATTGQLQHLTHKNFCLDRGLQLQADGTVYPHLWECHPDSDEYAYLQRFEKSVLI